MPTPATLKKRLQNQARSPKQKWDLNLDLTPPVRSRDVADVTRQLATMLQARLSLSRSLAMLVKQQKNRRLKSFLEEIKIRVEEGEPMSDSLKKYPRQFNDLYVNMVRVGELSGTLPDVLGELADYLEKMNTLKRKLTTAMTYPSVIILVAIGALSFLTFGVMPTFVEMFNDFETGVPGGLKLLVGIGDAVKAYGVLILVGAALLVFIFMKVTRQGKGRQFVDRLKLHLPMVGVVIRKVYISRFARTLGSMLANGISLLEALKVTAESCGNLIIRREVLRMRDQAMIGESMGDSLMGSKYFPDLVIQMIAVGEETAELPALLKRAGEYYESEVDAAIDVLTSVIEPVIIVILAVVLGGILSAVYMQIFDLMSVIG